VERVLGQWQIRATVRRDLSCGERCATLRNEMEIGASLRPVARPVGRWNFQ